MTSMLHLTAHDETLLDNPVWHALIGPHERFAEGGDLVRRYDPDVSVFAGVRTWEEGDVWEAAREVYAPGEVFALSHQNVQELPAGWEWNHRLPGVQMIATDAVQARPFADAVPLTPEDVPEVLAIVERNRPGPFQPRTLELGRYVGVFENGPEAPRTERGRLIAMVGERVHPEGWREISALSVDADHRRRGLASALLLDAVHAIRERGERALLHAAAANEGAIAGYRKLGFAMRREVMFQGATVPER